MSVRPAVPSGGATDGFGRIPILAVWNDSSWLPRRMNSAFAFVYADWMFTARPRACRIEDISCDSRGVRAGALTSGVLGVGGTSPPQALQSLAVLGLMEPRSNSRSLGFFLGERLWADRVLELTGALWARLLRLVFILVGFDFVGEVWGEVWVDLVDVFEGFGRCFLVPVESGVGVVSRDRLSLAACVGELLVVGAMFAVFSRLIVESQVRGR